MITGQLYFPDAITEQVYATSLPYRERKQRDTFNADDFIFVREGGAATMVKLDEEDGYYLASLIIGINHNR